MGIFAPIPMPQSGMDAFYDGLTKSQSIIDSLTSNKLKEAQAKRENKMADLPFGGANVPGPAGQIVGLEMIRQLYGVNSPQYQTAEKAFHLQQAGEVSRIGYQDALTKSMPLRYTTSQGRQIIEGSNVNQGYSPAGTPPGEPVVPGQGPPYNPDAPVSDVGNHYALRQTKEDLPASVMQKNLYATNIDKTLDDIDLDTLTQYNGPQGMFELRKQQALDALGKSDESYKKYKAQMDKLHFLASQTRQFYGDSIQPSAMEELVKRFDPTGVLTSKETGKSRFKSNAALLKKELKTYRDAARGTGVYHGNTESHKQSKEEGRTRTYNLQTGRFED